MSANGDKGLNPYTAIGLDPRNEMGISGGLITMVEPDLGHERAYNRWYEDDHFYHGAVVGPGVLGGRRWVATRDLQLLRFPEDSPVIQPVTEGAYISTYIHAADRFDDVLAWSGPAMLDNLTLKPGRSFEHRKHIYTAMQLHEFTVVRPDLPHMRAEHVFLHPMQGMVFEIVDIVEGRSREEVLSALRDIVIPGELTGSPIAIAIASRSHPPRPANPNPQSALPRPPGTPYGDGVALQILWFLQDDPRSWWSHFRSHSDKFEAVGGRLSLAAPFIPTIVGTDSYVDELR
jgi:hypothetical protein